MKFNEMPINFAQLLGQTASMSAKAGAAYQNIVASDTPLLKFEFEALAARIAYVEHDLKCLNDAFAVVVNLGGRGDL